jgi:predicted nucleotidyltransferase
VDLSLGIPGYEEEVMRRAVRVSYPGLEPLRFISAEDLIIHKCVAGRPRDLEDIERILVRQELELDLRYIRRWLNAFESLVETHDVKSVFEDAVQKARRMIKKGPRQRR